MELVLERKIKDTLDELREEMYKAYKKDPYGEKVLKISREIDELVNEVMKMPPQM